MQLLGKYFLFLCSRITEESSQFPCISQHYVQVESPAIKYDIAMKPTIAVQAMHEETTCCKGSSSDAYENIEPKKDWYVTRGLFESRILPDQFLNNKILLNFFIALPHFDSKKTGEYVFQPSVCFFVCLPVYLSIDRLTQKMDRSLWIWQHDR